MVATLIEALFGLQSKEQRLFIMRTGWVVFVSAHIMWVCGWLAPLSLASPFAHADVLAQLTKVVTDDRIDRLQRELLDMRVKQCGMAIGSPDRELYSKLVNELWGKYKELTGTDPRLPECKDL